jgi:hypothetical protein
MAHEYRSIYTVKRVLEADTNSFNCKGIVAWRTIYYQDTVLYILSFLSARDLDHKPHMDAGKQESEISHWVSSKTAPTLTDARNGFFWKVT